MKLSVVSLPYHPYIWSRSGSALPPAVEAAVDRVHLYEVPNDYRTAESLLSLYVADVLFLVYPGFHSNAAGETFTNVSYYTDQQDAEALSAAVRGVCRTTVSIGQVRHLLALAVEVYRIVCPIVFKSAVPDGRSTGHSLADLLCERHTIDDGSFSALLADYPRLVNELQRSFESEFLLFADMLRFVWCHEWAHGLAGHLRIQEGIARVQPSGTYERGRFRGPPALAQQALEFEADSLALGVTLQQIYRGVDTPGGVVAFQGDIAHRILWMLLAASVMMTYWYEVEPNVPLTQRRHPAAAFRYLNAWDLVRTDMIRRSENLSMKQAWLNSQLLEIIAKLGDVCASFEPILHVTPLVHETETMRRAREQVDLYRTVLEQLDLDGLRYQIDFSISDATPVVSGGSVC